MSRVFTMLAGVCALCIACAGCRTAQRPPKTEPPAISAEYAGGTPLYERPAAAPLPASAGVEILEVQAYQLANLAAASLDPFASKSTLITGSGDSSILALSEELADARIGQGDDVTAFVQQLTRGDLGPYGGPSTLRAAIALGMTIRLQAGDASSMSLLIGHDRPEQLRLGIFVPSSQTMALAGIARAAGQEQLLAIVLPTKPAGALAYVLKIRPPKDSSEAAKAIAALKPARPSAGAAPTFEQMLVQQTLKTAAENRSARRSAIVYLASQSHASICEDAAISADDDFLKSLTDELSSRLAEVRNTANMQSIGWTMDSAAFDLMGRLQLQKKLNPRLGAVLLIHTGEVGRSGSSLEQLIGKAASRADLDNRLIAENFLYLEDVSPAARARAYDWLNARGKAPQGYDPLGPAAQRKAAIDAAIDEMTRQGAEKSK